MIANTLIHDKMARLIPTILGLNERLRPRKPEPEGLQIPQLQHPAFPRRGQVRVLRHARRNFARHLVATTGYNRASRRAFAGLVNFA